MNCKGKIKFCVSSLTRLRNQDGTVDVFLSRDEASYWTMKGNLRNVISDRGQILHGCHHIIVGVGLIRNN